MADQISDAVLTPTSAGIPRPRRLRDPRDHRHRHRRQQITSKTSVDIPAIVRKTILEIGYDDPTTGFDGNCCSVMNLLNKQSPDIAMGVNAKAGKEQGAGDQGMMFGYACTETPELMPLPITLARRLTEGLAQLRENGTLKYLRPDGKSQVSVEYEGEIPVRVQTVVVSTQHTPDVSQKTIRKDMIEKLITRVIPKNLYDKNLIVHVNPTGRFVVGGPHGDTGVTGRKIIVDTYGGMGRHGGGAFSGKDPPRSTAPPPTRRGMWQRTSSRRGLAERCEVQISYAIGVAEPTSIHVNTFRTHRIPESQIDEIVRNNFRLTPRGIIESLNLKRPVYKETARWATSAAPGLAILGSEPTRPRNCAGTPA